MQVAHNCPGGDNKRCVRHLMLLTPAEHGVDRMVKKQAASGDRNGARLHPERFPKGERHYRTGFTEQNVRDIRTLRAEGLSLKEIAARYAVGFTTISAIVRRQNWAHLE
jgi:DNA-binding NarL/FixJ family response regulator